MPSMKRKPGLSGMNGRECIFDTGEEKRRREENGEKTDKVKVAGGKKFPACGLYEWIFLFRMSICHSWEISNGSHTFSVCDNENTKNNILLGRKSLRNAS